MYITDLEKKKFLLCNLLANVFKKEFRSCSSCHNLVHPLIYTVTNQVQQVHHLYHNLLHVGSGITANFKCQYHPLLQDDIGCF